MNMSMSQQRPLALCMKDTTMHWAKVRMKSAHQKILPAVQVVVEIWC